MVDLHSHILQCFDDGSKSIEETIKLIEMEIDNGVNTIALTPHFISKHYSISEFLKKRNAYIENLKTILSDLEVNINITAGAEVKLSPELLDEPDLSKLCYTNTGFMLVELPMSCYGDWIPETLYELRLRDITPVIAHVERYSYIFNHVELLYDLISSGSITQVNADSIISANYQLRSFIHNLIKHNLLHIIATDAHSVAHRPPRLQTAMQVIEKRYGQEVAVYLKNNSEDIINDRIPDLMEPINIRKRLFSGR